MRGWPRLSLALAPRLNYPDRSATLADSDGKWVAWMRVSNGCLAAWAMLVLTGCNCDPKGEPDASTPLTLEWPAGARLEITATTTSTAELKWPAALGPVASYRITWPGNGRDEVGTTTRLEALTLGQHLPVEVVAGSGSRADHAAIRTGARSFFSVSAMPESHRSLSARARS